MTEAEPPPATSRLARNAATLAGMSVSVVAVILLLTGVVGEVGYWRMMCGAFAILAVVTLVQNTELLHMADQANALMAQMATAVSRIQMAPAVRCAGCHTAVLLMGAEPREGAEDGSWVADRLPPGWEMVNDRPYCGECWERTNAGAN